MTVRQCVPFPGHFPDERRHAIDSSVATAYHHHVFAFFCIFESLTGTVALTFHAGVHTLGTIFQIGLHELEIVVVANYDISFPHCIHHGGCNVLFTARSYAHHSYLCHAHKIICFVCKSTNIYLKHKNNPQKLSLYRFVSLHHHIAADCFAIPQRTKRENGHAILIKFSANE